MELIIFTAFASFSLLFAVLFIVYKNKLNNLLLKDELSGLATTRKFISDAEKILATAKPSQYSIVSMDINSYRYITEAFGQKKGHQIIAKLGQHFKTVAPEGTLICRNYNDNFSILLQASFLPVIEDIVVNITTVPDEIKAMLPDHFKLEFSVGVFEIKNTLESIEVMMDKADSARKAGKTSFNPKRIFLFSSEMENSSAREKDIIFDMERALSENEFLVYYQPKFQFNTGKIIGAEALVRWNHKKRGILTPSYFIPLFEKNGFIEKIDLLVFENVCQFLDKWNKAQADKNEKQSLTISCNLSRVQLYNPNVAKIYKEIAAKYEIAPSKIEIELTESLMMDNKERLLKAMNDIKNAGFSISVDDFGSGFSSLGLLKDIPANVLKLDKEFLNTQKDTQKEHIIINSVINMAKELEMTTVAEGVEDKEQSDLLRKMGCDIVQGFFYAKPMPQDDFKELLNNN